MDWNDKEAVRAYKREAARRWRAAHPERARENNRRASATWRARNPEAWKVVRDRAQRKHAAKPETKARRLARNRMRIFGLTEAEYAEWLMRSAHGCEICGSAAGISFDHDHQAGGLVGILCRDCNIGIGLFRDDPQRLRAAASYVERTRKREAEYIAVAEQRIGLGCVAEQVA